MERVSFISVSVDDLASLFSHNGDAYIKKGSLTITKERVGNEDCSITIQDGNRTTKHYELLILGR